MRAMLTSCRSFSARATARASHGDLWLAGLARPVNAARFLGALVQLRPRVPRAFTAFDRTHLQSRRFRSHEARAVAGPQTEGDLLMRRTSTPTTQLGFDSLLAEADRKNAATVRDARYSGFPETMPEAVVYCRTLIERHHGFMTDADLDSAMACRQEAHALALHLNGDDPGILAGPEAAGCVLDVATAAPQGSIPLWGQAGDFILTISGMQVRIDLDGVFGIGATALPFPGFAAHVVDRDAPFLSDTGFRSFLGFHMKLTPGLNVESYLRAAIAHQIKADLKGRLVRVARRAGD
jgi:hypothetical protein